MEAIVQKGGGVKIHYFWYWNNAFRNPEVIKTAVPVRYDPFNLGVAYAQVQGQWVTCRASYPVLEGHTERELFIATQELRKQARRNGEHTTITSARLAALIEKAVSHEAVLAQRLCDLEEQRVLALIAEQSGFPQRFIQVLLRCQRTPRSLRQGKHHSPRSLPRWIWSAYHNWGTIANGEDEWFL